MLENLTQVLPQIAIISAVCAALGWSLRGIFTKPESTSKALPPGDPAKQDRVRNLEATLEKARASQKAAKAELEALQSNSVTKAEFDATNAELDRSRKELSNVGKRISSLETDLKKSQETIRQLNNRANEIDRAQKDRKFALENELSKVREQLAILENRPDDSSNLQEEIERLRESVATSTRYAGELRKREATAIEALERAQAQLADANSTPRSAPVSKKIGPVADSERVSAAKAEVLRLIEENKKRASLPLADDLPTPTALEVPTVVESAKPTHTVNISESETTESGTPQ